MDEANDVLAELRAAAPREWSIHEDHDGPERWSVSLTRPSGATVLVVEGSSRADSLRAARNHALSVDSSGDLRRRFSIHESSLKHEPPVGDVVDVDISASNGWVMLGATGNQLWLRSSLHPDPLALGNHVAVAHRRRRRRPSPWPVGAVRMWNADSAVVASWPDMPRLAFISLLDGSIRSEIPLPGFPADMVVGDGWIALAFGDQSSAVGSSGLPLQVLVVRDDGSPVAEFPMDWSVDSLDVYGMCPTGPAEVALLPCCGFELVEISITDTPPLRAGPSVPFPLRFARALCAVAGVYVALQEEGLWLWRPADNATALLPGSWGRRYPNVHAGPPGSLVLWDDSAALTLSVRPADP
jgi:hypothetical protein